MSIQSSRILEWVEPLAVVAGLRDVEGVLCLLSDGSDHGRWSWVGAQPDRIAVGPMGPDDLGHALTPHMGRQVVGLIAYDWGARPATGQRADVWPDLMLARYPSLLGFDHARRRVVAFGLAADSSSADERVAMAASWLSRAIEIATPSAPAETFEAEPGDYPAAVADVVARIAAGELFQANIARGWAGRLKATADPMDVFLRLASGPAPYGAYWRLGERALVSNSPELFVTFDPRDRRIETRPIKGTRARSADPVEDQARAAELVASTKDRAENLMIVDLMRNDLARVCEPGSVRVERLFSLESFATVHHLVSTVTGRVAPGHGAADILNATFPPGSITGAPKHQAMKVIATHEPPRGAWCGSLFLLEGEGTMTASVLIRTISLWRDGQQWRYRTQAGAGITADSDPRAELAETEAKIVAIRRALLA